MPGEELTNLMVYSCFQVPTAGSMHHKTPAANSLGKKFRGGMTAECETCEGASALGTLNLHVTGL